MRHLTPVTKATTNDLQLVVDILDYMRYLIELLAGAKGVAITQGGGY